jgi:Uma2 family endonuclease
LSEHAPTRGQFTFACGELIIDMSPEAFETHNCIKSEVSAVIYMLVKQRSLGRFFSDRFLLSNPVAGISTEPDATFVASDSLRTGRCQVVRSERPGVCDELVGSPDWILEILSRSSVRKDKKLLYDGYFRAGVDEYWLIDALGEEIDFQIFNRGADSFIPVKPKTGWFESPTFGCAFQLSRQKAKDGFWEYTLRHQ